MIVLVDLDFYKDKITIKHSGSSDSRLTFNGFDTTMEGIYYCKANSPLGEAWSIGTKVSIPCEFNYVFLICSQKNWQKKRVVLRNMKRILKIDLSF